MDRDSPPNWNFFGTVERLIKATETLLDQDGGYADSDGDLARNMIMRLTVIMEDAGNYMSQEDEARRARLEKRLREIRTRFDLEDCADLASGTEKLMIGGNRTQFGRVPV